LLLAIPARIDPKGAFAAHLSTFDRNEIDVMGLNAVHTEVVNLSEIVPLADLRIGMVRIRAAGSEADSSRLKSSGLALHSSESGAFIDDKVVTQVLAKGNEDGVACTIQRDHNRKL
jgi:hypothetical protein